MNCISRWRRLTVYRADEYLSYELCLPIVSADSLEIGCLELKSIAPTEPGKIARKGNLMKSVKHTLIALLMAVSPAIMAQNAQWQPVTGAENLCQFMQKFMCWPSLACKRWGLATVIIFCGCHFF